MKRRPYDRLVASTIYRENSEAARTFMMCVHGVRRLSLKRFVNAQPAIRAGRIGRFPQLAHT